MTNTKALFILFKAFFLTQCELFKKNETVWSVIYGIAGFLTIGLGIKNDMLYLAMFILIERSINFFLLRRDIRNHAK